MNGVTIPSEDETENRSVWFSYHGKKEHFKIPPNLKPDRFWAGWRHAWGGGQLDKVEYFKESFRTGYRTGKLVIREFRKIINTPELPAKWRGKNKAYA